LSYTEDTHGGSLHTLVSTTARQRHCARHWDNKRKRVAMNGHQTVTHFANGSVINSLVKQIKTAAKGLIGARRDGIYLWLRWAQARTGAIRGLRPIFRGLRVEWDAPGHAWTVPFDVAGPDRGQVLVRAIASAVSVGTERAMYSLQSNTVERFPRYPGYSSAGEIWELGKDVRDLHRGQLVAMHASHASLALASAKSVFPLPVGVRPEEGSFISLGIIALHGIWRGGLHAGERAAVFGRGPIGHLVIQLARALGAAEVISIAPSRRHHTPQLARFSQRIIASVEEGENVLNTVQADLTYEASGEARAVGDAVRATRDGGRVVLIGSPRALTRDFDFGELADRRISLIGAHLNTLSRDNSVTGHNYRQAGETFLRLIAEDALDVGSLISVEVNPWEVGWFYRQLAYGQRQWLGGLMKWGSLSNVDRLKNVSYWTLPESESVRGKSILKPATLKNLAKSDTSACLGTMDARPKIQPARQAQLLRVAVIGCGQRGTSSAAQIQRAEHTRLAMVMDANGELACRLGEQSAVPWTTDYSELLANDAVDAVFICTPHHLHADQAIAAAQTGKHIIVEKPLARNLEEATRAVRAARDAGVQLSVWLGTRYLPQVVKAKQLVESGAVGNILGAHVAYHRYTPAHYWQQGAKGGGTDWRSKWETAGGGVLIMTAIHYLDWLLYLSGLNVKEVSARYGTLDSPIQVEDAIVIWLTFQNGALATLNVSSCVQGLGRELVEFRLWGTEGCISLSEPFQFYSSRLVDGKRPERWQSLKPLPKLRREQIEFLDRFALAVLKGEPPEITGEDGLRVQAFIEAAYRSSREGRAMVVNYPEI
jgi:predicted dehydrogenase/NADPH:quinone reductase-like Zn-dependent oxidoreductase